MLRRWSSFRRGDFVFGVIDEGPDDGPVVVLLHGFPQFNSSWNGVISRLTARGYRCLAPNQRGYSPGARPRRRRDYRAPDLAADVRALIEASGAERVHLVGHDAGATVAWVVADEMPERLASLTTLSVPHPAAFLNAMVTSRQVLASWYIAFYQLPGIPEWYFRRHDWSGMSNFTQRLTNQSAEDAIRDARAMAESGALRYALNWYRAVPLTDMRRARHKITVPTMYVWSDGDTAVLRKGARNTARYVTADYRFGVLEGVSHWIPDEQPDALADLLLDWFDTHPDATGYA
jgi:pimeloyl-ACP methyl ester carboxylesterase